MTVTTHGPSEHQRPATAGWMIGAAALSLLFTVRTAIDPDYWWHLAVGRITITHGFPRAEPFSFLPATHHWVDQQWAFEVLLATINNVGAALAIMGGVGTLALVLAVLAAPRDRETSRPLGAAVIVVSALVVTDIVGVRGQVFTMLGTAITIWIIARWREGATRVVWSLPPLLWVWANVHAGFFVGLAVPLTAAMVVAGARRGSASPTPVRIRPLLLATGSAVLATLINPAGPGIYRYIADALTTPAITQGIAEWQSPDFHTWLIRLVEVEAALLIGLWTAGHPDPLDVVLALGALIAALAAERNVALFAVIAAPQLVTYGTSAVRTHLVGPHGAPRLPTITLAGGLTVALMATVAILPRLSPQSTRSAEQSGYPAGAVTYVADHCPGQRVFTREVWGGYLAGRIPSGRVVFIYGDSVVFGAGAVDRYDAVTLVQATWLTELADDHISVAIVPRDSQETSALTEVGWRITYADHAADALVMQPRAIVGNAVTR